MGLVPRLNLTSGLANLEDSLGGLVEEYRAQGGFWSGGSLQNNVVNAVQLGVKASGALFAPLVNGFASAVPITVPSVAGHCLTGTPIPPEKRGGPVKCLIGTGAQVTDYLAQAADSLAGMAGRVLERPALVPLLPATAAPAGPPARSGGGATWGAMADASYFASRRPAWAPAGLPAALEIASRAPLEACSSRQACPNCGRSRFLYCYDCCLPFTEVPSLTLPFRVSIITHHAEALSKNTGVHAALLCGGQVDMHSVEQLPAGVDPARCAVLFPSDDALLPEQLDVAQLDRVVIIDSKWRKAKEINCHPALARMPRVRWGRAAAAGGRGAAAARAAGSCRRACPAGAAAAGQVKLPGSPRSAFWRFHTDGTSDEGVCTIEALHLLLRALAARLPGPPWHAAPAYFDNLLWFFAHQHQLVARAAAERQAKRAAAAGGGGEGEGEGEGGGEQPLERYPLQPSRKRQKQQQAAPCKPGAPRGQQQQEQQQQEQQEREQEGHEQQQQQERQEERHPAGAGRVAAGVV
ncbi:dtwd1 [Scenedesmus sp. PABB004]|nr:dtwd1 [Scenedesmus sp. PABB004]